MLKLLWVPFKNKVNIELIKCECSCGSVFNMPYLNITSWKTDRCYHCSRLKWELKRWYSRTPLYKKYTNMVSRCYYKLNDSYKSHGDKGIKVCDEWMEWFHIFDRDMREEYDKHIELYWRANTTLDRIDSTKDYSKENCRRATYEIQNNNLSFNRNYEYKWELLSVSQIARKIGMNVPTLFSRLNISHMSIEEAISKPCIKRVPKK